MLKTQNPDVWQQYLINNNDPFPIHAGVRQGCVLSRHLLCSVLQWGMSAWRINAETRKCSFDLSGNMAFLLDVRFADDILFLHKQVQKQ